MLKQAACLAITLTVFFGFNHSIRKAIGFEQREACGPGAISRIASGGDAADQNSKSKEYEELEEDLRALMEEMKRLERNFSEKIRKEILPLIKREIERLRELLRKFQLEDDEPKPKSI
jgi:hypothetical protein